ncbi:Copper/zinc superoxide dismutase 1 [Pyrus ussuriensis x Pyrus communis]|uniref:Copper/zinc superoxide dismutase 1 n=1 Tax=Pyrus ussuriensis x Pyrus communis TaxID=2448454 RepID=A0A5N5H926_9ROSA|nr:Copper/zinc superoxide dismutase 1 [Pyrus ussuriensis x Pyrus communis]
MQCERPVDCISLCYGCLANKCRTGRCVCGCANNNAIAEAITATWQHAPHHFCYWDWQCKHMATCPSGCNANKCNNGYCSCTC